MIKKITLVILLFFVFISCGKKGDPQYIDPEKKAKVHKVLISKEGPIFFADTTVNIDPSVQEIVDITLLVARTVKQYKIKPKIAMLSYSNVSNINRSFSGHTSVIDCFLM
mgnify:CR=1 FL=1